MRGLKDISNNKWGFGSGETIICNEEVAFFLIYDTHGLHPLHGVYSMKKPMIPCLNLLKDCA
jgi:hypothetical protein